MLNIFYFSFIFIIGNIIYNLFSQLIYKNHIESKIWIKDLQINDTIFNMFEDLTLKEFNRQIIYSPFTNDIHYSAGILPRNKIEKYNNNIINYYNNDMPIIISNIINETVYPTNKNNHLLLLAYNKENDKVEFHYDTNIYKNKMISVIILIKSSNNSCSHFEYIYNNELYSIDLKNRKRGTAIIYKGNSLFHRVTKQCKNEERYIWNSVYIIDNYKPFFFNEILNSIYNVGYTKSIFN